MGWLKQARDELARAKKDVPGEWGKDETDQLEKARTEIDRAETKMALDAVEAAVGSGRYEAARRFLANYPFKGEDPKDTLRRGTLSAQVESMQPRFESAVRLLGALIERETGGTAAATHAALGGPVAGLHSPRPPSTPEMRALLVAGATILGELHPDTTARVDLFLAQAEQDAKRRAEGKDPIDKPEELLALAITGWLKGKNGAEKNVASALRCWETREMALGYIREPVGNKRSQLLDAYLKNGKPLGPDELSQIITLLPPPSPDDLQNIRGEKVPVSATGLDGIYKCNATSPLLPAGADYYLRLPPEYHHGRSYPVIMALTGHELPSEQMIALLSGYADQFGYIVAAPVWTNQFAQKGNKAYDFTGKDHPKPLAVLRDLQRRFQVDTDKVFLMGFNDGANFALDFGMSHPDLFAGMIPIGPNPPQSIYINYWKNNQKLPTYVVAGDMAGTPGNLRSLYQKWMQPGYPALMTLYKGRGPEWFPIELPRIFDWMGRKTRVRGTASLRLNQAGFEPWQILRESDNRFYWVGIPYDGMRFKNNVANGVPKGQFNPAQFRADIEKDGSIKIDEVRGVKKFVIWLDRDLIDWSRPVRVTVNGLTPNGYTPKKLEPDLHIMFEHLYLNGDRKLLFQGMIEVNSAG
ncbi:hypothetical protein [Fimbriiglobus ruber]|uniref:Uncharacterized protein n=1 Tax=Fimbriiglobus ruber TaxID=1908690 RepID=A0A225D3V4_9BACT|nr:hypothetical protein [Fimbriiglobus ruber]OWK36281.1 hypothetical protein FRUB_08844 [Fimbriiglobus ruber]